MCTKAKFVFRFDKAQKAPILIVRLNIKFLFTEKRGKKLFQTWKQLYRFRNYYWLYARATKRKYSSLLYCLDGRMLLRRTSLLFIRRAIATVICWAPCLRCFHAFQPYLYTKQNNETKTKILSIVDFLLHFICFFSFCRYGLSIWMRWQLNKLLKLRKLRVFVLVCVCVSSRATLNLNTHSLALSAVL